MLVFSGVFYTTLSRMTSKKGGPQECIYPSRKYPPSRMPVTRSIPLLERNIGPENWSFGEGFLEGAMLVLGSVTFLAGNPYHKPFFAIIHYCWVAKRSNCTPTKPPPSPPPTSFVVFSRNASLIIFSKTSDHEHRITDQTLNFVRVTSASSSPCGGRWSKLLLSLDKTYI